VTSGLSKRLKENRPTNIVVMTGATAGNGMDAARHHAGHPRFPNGPAQCR
jgi:hypothetical protein